LWLFLFSLRSNIATVAAGYLYEDLRCFCPEVTKPILDGCGVFRDHSVLPSNASTKVGLRLSFPLHQLSLSIHSPFLLLPAHPPYNYLRSTHTPLNHSLLPLALSHSLQLYLVVVKVLVVSAHGQPPPRWTSPTGALLLSNTPQNHPPLYHSKTRLNDPSGLR